MRWKPESIPINLNNLEIIFNLIYLENLYKIFNFEINLKFNN